MKNRPIRKWIALLVMFFFIFTVSCHSWHPVEVSSPQQLPISIAVGDRVKVTTRGGEIHEFKITRITANGLQGERKGESGSEPVQLSYDEIQSVEKEEFSILKTGGLMLGIYGGYILAVLLIFFVIFPPY